MAPWKCVCGNTNKASAVYCASCGSKWDEQTYSGSWHGKGKGHGWIEEHGRQAYAPSPRRWTEPAQPWRGKSPRRRPKGPGRGKGQDPGKSKGKGNGVPGPQEPAGPAAPTMKLPEPPVRQSLPAPTGQARDAGQTGANTADRQALDRLLQAMKASEQELTPQLREILEQHKHEDAKEEARSLHKLVTSKASAKKELTRLRAARASYLQAWSGYLDQVIGTIQTQLEEHSGTMTDFLQKENQWEQALLEATTELARRTADSSEQVETITDGEEDEMDASEAKVEEACQAELQTQRMAERAQAISQQSQSILQGATGSQGAGRGGAAEGAGERTDTKKSQARRRCQKGGRRSFAPWQGLMSSHLVFMGPDTIGHALGASPLLHPVVSEWDFALPQAARWYALQLQYDLIFEDLGVMFTPGQDSRVTHAETLFPWDYKQDLDTADAVGLCSTAGCPSVFQCSSYPHGAQGADVIDATGVLPRCCKAPRQEGLERHDGVRDVNTFCRQLAGCTGSDAAQTVSVPSPSSPNATTRSQRVQALWPCTASVPETCGAGQNAEAGFEVSSLPFQVNVHEDAKVAPSLRVPTSASGTTPALGKSIDPWLHTSTLAHVKYCAQSGAAPQSQRVQAFGPCTAPVHATAGTGQGAEASFEISPPLIQGKVYVDARAALSQRVQACSPGTAHVHNDKSCAVDAQSQHVRPGDSAALDLQPCITSHVVCPTTGARGSSRPGLVDLRIQLASRVALFPEELDRPEVRGQQVSQFWWFTGFRASGSVGDTPQQDRFALFTTASHVEVRSMRRGITLDAFITEIYSVVPGLRSLRILLERLDGLPAVQIAATTREAPPLGCAMPVDLRGVEGRVCTINLLPGATTNMVSQEILSSCPPARRPQVPFRLFLPDGRAFVAIPYQVSGPDFIRGRALPEHVDEAAHDSEEEALEEDQPAFLQTGIACSAVAKGSAPTASVCPHEDVLRPEVWGSDSCPVAFPVRDPPTLLRTEGPPRASVVHSTTKVPTILPERLAAPNIREIPAGQLCLFCQTAAHHNELRRYSVFDRNRHHVVRKASVHWSLLDYIVDATSSASEETQSVQVLTLPIADLPEPQLTITPIGLPPGVLVLPLDARSIGGPLCALPLPPGLDFQRVLEALARVAPSTAQLLEQALQLDGVFLQDPTGRIWETLPMDLSEVQWLKVVLEPRVQQQLRWLVTLGGPTTMTSTAVMTTQQVSNPTETVSFVLAGGGTVIRLAPQPIRLASVRQSLCELLFILGLQGRVPHRPVVSFASAAPRQAAQPANRIVIFLVYPASDIGEICHILQDYSLDGSLLQEMSVDCDVVAGHLISEAHRSSKHPRRHVTPIDALYDILPDLRFFSMPLRVPSLLQLMRDPAAGLGRQEVIKDAMQRSLDTRILERRVEVGEPGHNCQAILVLGPEHPPLLLYMPSNVAPSLAEATTYLAWSGFFEPGTTFVDPQVFAHTFPVFVSVPKGSQRATILFPAPYTLLHWLQLNVPLGTPLQGFGLPVRRNFELVLPARTTHGAVIRERLIGGRASSPDPEGVGLLQVGAQLLKQRPTGAGGDDPEPVGAPMPMQTTHVVAPTPFGRRGVPRSPEVGASALAASSRPRLEPPVVPAPDPTLECVAAQPRPCARQTLTLQDLLPGHDCQQEAQLCFATPSDNLRHALAPFHLNTLCRDVLPASHLHPAAAELLAHLPPRNAELEVEAAMLFVDGSFEHAVSTWAVAVLVCQQGQWRWAGYQADAVPSALSPSSAYDGELFGQFVAHGIVASAEVPAAIFFDSTSASLVATAQASTCAHTALSRAVAVLKGRLAPVPLSDEHVVSYILQGDFDTIWIHRAHNRRGIWPQFDDHGDALPIVPWPQRSSVDTPAQWAFDSQAGTERLCRLKGQIATYNTLSAVSLLQRQCLSSFMRQHGILFAGFQECRQASASPIVQDGVLRLSSPSPEGRGGCQLWADLHALPGGNMQQFSVHYRHPRLLVVLYQAGGLRIAFVVGYSPDSTTPEEERVAWWELLKARLHSLPPNTAPILLLDANARYRAAQAEEPAEVPTNANAQAFDAILQEYQLSRTPACDAKGLPYPTWRSPQGVWACLDYLAVPAIWQDGFQPLGVQPILDTHAGIDHQPVLAKISVNLLVPEPPKCRLNVDLMRSPAGVARIRETMRSLPDCPWHMDVDDHLAAINNHIHQCIHDHFLKPVKSARKPGVSAFTMELLRAKRQCRRRSFKHDMKLNMVGRSYKPPRIAQGIEGVYAGSGHPAAGKCPLLWRGLLAVPLPKPNKPSHRVTGYRSIALQEPAAKAVSKSMRPALVTGFQAVCLDSVGGARPDVATDYPASGVQLHLRALKRQGISGSVVFVDGVSAFYAVRRELLFTDSLQTVLDRVQGLPVEAEVRQRFVQSLKQHGALTSAKIPEAVQRLLKTTLSATWFTTDPANFVAQHTFAGTIPGAPLADLLFQFCLDLVLHALADHLEAEDIQARLFHDGAQLCSAAPLSWLDDLAILLQAKSPDRAAPDASRATALIGQYLSIVGATVPLVLPNGAVKQRLLTNQFLTLAERQTLFASLADEVCTLLRAMMPEEALAQSRVRVLAGLGHNGGHYLQAQCAADPDWVSALRSDVSFIAKVLADESLQSYAAMLPDSNLEWIKSWPWTKERTRVRLAAFRQAAIRSRQGRHAQVCHKAKAHNRVLELGACFHRLADPLPENRIHPCPECKAMFLTKAAATAHRAACHDVRSDAAFAVGTACEVCRRQFWDTKRLSQHFRSSPRCAAVHREADLQPTNKEVLADKRMPPHVLVGPAPWWSTMTHEPSTPPDPTPNAVNYLQDLLNMQIAKQVPLFFRMLACSVESQGRDAVLDAIQSVQGSDEWLLVVQVASVLGQDCELHVFTAGQSMAAFQAGNLLLGPAAAVREILADGWRNL
ncbi:unnamed protein product [Symbiodinium necroappetens]|uniref:C2H2-type domain-containing protein n=1 Tax=Symbiodinium necroappetens TaxID=1628268 RepID=A0A813AG27_9DINO|nr:unnamed protein product [Symbiodinium necroappetens]